MSSITITRPAEPIHTTIELPRSKSAANRALVIAALLGDVDLVQDPGNGDDTRILLEHLRERPAVMHCGAGATTFRFLLAWACCQEGEERLITGTQRLLDRPHADLVGALRTLGAHIEQVPEGYRVRGTRLQGGAVHFDSPISSQYLSALLLIAPSMEQGLSLRWTGTRLSEPYVHMTLKIMAHFGVFPVMELDGVRVSPGSYTAAAYTVPPDWSAAAFWYEVVALSPGAEVLLAGLDEDTLQGDREARHLFAAWVRTTSTTDGLLLTHIDNAAPWSTTQVPGRPVNLKHVPDLFQPLAFTLATRGEGATLEGLDNLRVKETDRLKATHDALAILGRGSSILQGTFTITPNATDLISSDAPFDPSIDHRMAMALAPLAAVLGRVTINDPQVVDKSYPHFWNDLEHAGFAIALHA
jgi:3-phosphoshikimate 1-carboxyvinyltransferase